MKQRNLYNHVLSIRGDYISDCGKWVGLTAIYRRPSLLNYRRLL